MTRKKIQYFKPSPINPHNHLTIGELKKQLHGLPDDAPVFYEVIEDWYFDNGVTGLNQHNGWADAHSSIFIPSGRISPDSMHHYVRAWAAWPLEVYKNGRQGLVLSAHY